MRSFEAFINEYFQNFYSSSIKDAAYYSLMAGGKRFRPQLLFAVLDGFNLPRENGFHSALAIEMIHTYSLIHDDLPCMDNDDYRRGKPSCHKAYGENTAVLAGDALITESFKVICADPHLTSKQKIAIVAKMSQYAGINGMIYGQYLDLKYENDQTADVVVLQDIDYYKTACLFILALEMGMVIAHDEANREFYRSFGAKLGSLFQIQDDLFDIIKSSEETGKPQGSDLKNNKLTALSFYDRDTIDRLLKKTIAEIVELLNSQKFDTSFLLKIVEKIKDR